MTRYQEIITIEPGKEEGKPCIRGMRITVGDVLGWLSAGMTHEEILADFPELTEEDIRACLAFTANRQNKARVRFRYVDGHYHTLPFPFNEIAIPDFEMQAQWNLDDLVGFLRGWSAVHPADKILE